MDFHSLKYFIFSSLFVISSQKLSVEQGATVYPQVYEDREDSSEKTVVINDGYSLHLRKASVFAARVLLREITESGINERYLDGARLERYLHEDMDKEASLVIKPLIEGGYHVVGLLNSTHKIHPVELTQRMVTGKRAHMVSKLTVNEGIDGAAEIERNVREETVAERYIPGFQLPKNFTLELFFASDFNHTAAFSDQDAHIEYVMLLVHSVSLHLQGLNPPGFVALTGIQACYNMRNPHIILNNKGKVLGMETINKMSGLHFTNATIAKADALYLATSRDIVGNRSGHMTSDVLGNAYIGGVCSAYKFAIGEDTPRTFSGLPTMVHEIGHLLGCHHDGEEEAKLCKSSLGYIMSPHAHGNRNYEFSKCSKKAVSVFLQHRSSSCLRRNDTQRIVSSPKLAMQIRTVVNGAEFCKSFFLHQNNVSYIKVQGEDNCSFRCQIGNKNGQPNYAILTAPNGVPCDNTKPYRECRNGFCHPYV